MRLACLAFLVSFASAPAFAEKSLAPEEFSIGDKMRCRDSKRGSGAPAQLGRRAVLDSTAWMEITPSPDLKKSRDTNAAVLRPWRFGGKIGSGATASAAADAMLMQGPEPMRVGGVRVCSVDGKTGGVLTRGVPGIPEGTIFVVELQLSSME